MSVARSISDMRITLESVNGFNTREVYFALLFVALSTYPVLNQCRSGEPGQRDIRISLFPRWVIQFFRKISVTCMIFWNVPSGERSMLYRRLLRKVRVAANTAAYMGNLCGLHNLQM
jgi:hypothetical protein